MVQYANDRKTKEINKKHFKISTRVIHLAWKLADDEKLLTFAFRELSQRSGKTAKKAS